MEGRKVHLMGICGSGMSSLALWYAQKGFKVSGCDVNSGENAAELAKEGIEVLKGHDPSHADGIDMMVFSAAVPSDHPELLCARGKGVQVLRRSEALAELANSSMLLAIAGAHGKTTVTAMTGWILQEAGMDPTVMVGGGVREWGGNFRSGGSLAVVEADEYDRAFLRLRPQSAAVTSFALEHLECYGTAEALSAAFGIFLEMTRPGGTVTVPRSRRDLAVWAERIGRNIVTTGPGGDIHCRAGKAEGWHQDYDIDGIAGTLPLPGEHNLRNAETALSLALSVGVDTRTSVIALSSFPGVRRRLEKIGELGLSLLISDYAHHPDEIRASLQAVSGASAGRIGVVFQPHLYSRTAQQGEEMGRALAGADWSLVLPVYPAREEPVQGVSSVLVVEGALRAGGNCGLCEPDDLEEHIARRSADVIVFMGAGSVDSHARRIAGASS